MEVMVASGQGGAVEEVRGFGFGICSEGNGKPTSSWNAGEV